MNRLALIVGYAATFGGVVLACVGEDPGAAAVSRGGEREACFENDTCLEGLSCVSGVCVKLGGTAEDAADPGDTASDAVDARVDDDADASTCPASNVSFTSSYLPMHALRLGQCSDNAAETFVAACLEKGGADPECQSWRGANATCLACILGDAESSGPVIALEHQGAARYFTNFGGCYEKHTPGCGKPIDDMFKCQLVACEACPQTEVQRCMEQTGTVCPAAQSCTNAGNDCDALSTSAGLAAFIASVCK